MAILGWGRLEEFKIVTFVHFGNVDPEFPAWVPKKRDDAKASQKSHSISVLNQMMYFILRLFNEV